MDVTEALSLFWEEVDRSSLRAAARKAQVSHSTAAEWKDRVPTGETREKLIAWAEQCRALRSVPTAVVQRARAELAETHRDLARIYGYAESVVELAEQIALKQRNVLSMLRPWVDVETDVRAGRVGAVLDLLTELDAETTMPSAPPDAPPKASTPRKKKSG